MIESIYLTLTKLSYTHPLHPTLTHLPIGMVMGAFCFVLAALIFRRTKLAQTARHCSVLALIAALPTAFLGILDWQHFYGGLLLFPIKMKLALACILTVFLILAVIFGFFGETFSKFVISLYVLCLFSVIGLGYFGGELVYGTKAPAAGAAEGPAAEGAMVLKQNCSACHLTDSTATNIGPGLKGVFFFLASTAVCIHSMAAEILLSPPGLRLIKDPSLRNSFFKAFYPVNWTYARFNRDGNSSITSAKVRECHQCHSIAFHLTGDLIFTQFP